MLMRAFVACLLAVSLPLAAAAQNQLRDHPSPYLALHGEDPVHWQVWGESVLERARALNKPLFISSGYFACHWCHVMQRESYQNPAIARLLNEHFIPVKIDRELQSALDAHLIEFVRRTRGHAGWPLNVFLTPEGYPLVGLTYSPPEAFENLLERVRDLWSERAGELQRTARTAALATERKTAEEAPQAPDPQLLHDALLRAALAIGDEMEGGFGRQNRFPMAPQWSVLLERLQQRPDDQLRSLVTLSLDQMASQGLRDHIGGGFFRYTVDPGWQVPHYEKMLYTQALLARLYLQAAAVLERADYLEVARDTLDFTLRAMRGRGGGYIASFSAIDSSGREGGGYLWSQAMLAAVLQDDELQFARKRWRLEGAAPTEEGYLPIDAVPAEVLMAKLGIEGEPRAAFEQRVKRKLLEARAPRAHPRDAKQLAAWNGLLLSALVDAARVLQQERYRDAARDLRDYLTTRLWNGERLLRAFEAGGELGRAALEDYVYVAAGLRDWAVLSGSEKDRALAHKLMQEAWSRFFLPQGWQATDKLLLPGIARERAISDGPLPSPAALLIELSLTSGDAALVGRAERALRLGYPLAQEQPLWYATQVAASIRLLTRDSAD